MHALIIDGHFAIGALIEGRWRLFGSSASDIPTQRFQKPFGFEQFRDGDHERQNDLLICGRGLADK